MKNYQPAEGSQAARAIAILAEHGPLHAWQLAEKLGVPSKNIGPLLVHPIKHGLVVKSGRQKTSTYSTPGDHRAKAVDDIARQLDGDAPAPSEPLAELTISAWSDGDVVIAGPGLRYSFDDNAFVSGVTLSHQQMQQLVAFVKRPMVAVVA